MYEQVVGDRNSRKYDSNESDEITMKTMRGLKTCVLSRTRQERLNPLKFVNRTPVNRPWFEVAIQHDSRNNMSKSRSERRLNLPLPNESPEWGNLTG